MLTPYLPYPLVSGGQIRTYNLLKHLHGHHNITLFAYIRNEKEREYIKYLEPFCAKIIVFKRSPVWTISNVFRSVFSYSPLLMTMYRSEELKKAIARELSEKEYNLIHAETFYMMPNIPATLLPKILVVQTIEHLGYLEFTKKNKNIFFKPFMYWDVWKIRHWEEYYWRAVSQLITMSETDKQYISDQVPSVNQIDVIANGVDLDFFDAVKKKSAKTFTVLFVGTFKWLPNLEAVRYLVEKVWPLIREEIKEAQLMIVGNSPTKEVIRFGELDDRIHVEGHIDDIREAYSKASVLVAPVWSGKGTRYKILEAMATYTPVVATTTAVEGLGVIPGKHALIADNAQQLALDTKKIFDDKKMAAALGKAGRTLVEQNYDWTSISTKLDTVYQKVGRSNG